MSHNKGKDYFSVAEFKDVGGDVVRALPPERIHNFSDLPENSRFKTPLDAKIDTNESGRYMRLVPNQHQGRSGRDGNEKMLKYRSDGVMEGSSEYMGNSRYTTHLDAGMRNYQLEGSQDRRELLRKLEELNNQLSRSGGLDRTPKEKSTLGRDFAQNDANCFADGWLSDDCSVMSKDSKYPYANLHEPHIHRLQHDTLRNGSSFESRIPRRPLTLKESSSSQYLHHQNFPLYLPGQYIDADPDAFERPYQYNDLLHRLSCSCRHCYYKHQNSIQPIPHINSHDSRFANLRSNPMRYHSNSLVPGDYDFRVARDPSLLYDPTTHMRGNVDFNPRVGGLHPHRNKGERCYPVGGGAPFMTCRNCFELLWLPIKLLKLEDRRQHKLRCGACSTLIYYCFQENKLLISADEELKSDGDSGELMDSTIRTDTKFSSEGLHSSSNDVKLFDEERPLPSTDRSLNTKDTNCIAFAAVSISSSEEECSQLNLKPSESKMHCSIDFPEYSGSTAPPPSSPLQQHFHYSSPDEKGNQSRQSEHELVIPKVVPSERKLLSEVSMAATELEVSCNDYSNSGISQESGDGGKEVHHDLQINRKKSCKDISKHDQVGEGEITSASVTINGHPLSDRIVKKAARRAGRIQPGNYWYDIRAGFWGVMGGPCLGIIPPFIEEFNYPLAENCTGGATGVFVNGRELHEKDLELLSLRGLPTTRDRSYIVEISGRVLEEGSGKELDSLGRLARTVEKAKHGFGMKVPKQIVVNKIEQQ